MKNNHNSTHRHRNVPNITTYPHASRICSRHGSSINQEGKRQVYARNTFMTQDSREKVLAYFSRQLGQPIQQDNTVCWHQETQSESQHIVVELIVGNDGVLSSERTVIKSYCIVTLNSELD